MKRLRKDWASEKRSSARAASSSNIACVLTIIAFFYSVPIHSSEVIYTIIDLGLLDICVDPSPPYSTASGINDVGDKVTGWSCSKTGDAAFIWDESMGMQYIGTLGLRSLGMGINNEGQITGLSRLDSQNVQEHAFLWDSESGMLDLGTFLSGDDSAGRGINNVGQVVGSSGGTAFLWDQINGMQNFGTAEGDWSVARDINDEGQITGIYSFDHKDRAFIWDIDNGLQNLGSLGAGNSMGRAINNNGQVVGDTDTMEGGLHAFIWDEANGMQDLGTLGGVESWATDINNLGQVVGIYQTESAEYRAFLWDERTGMQDLCKLANCTESGLEIYRVEGIADNGSIVGTSFDPMRAILLKLKDIEIIFSDGFEN